MREREEEREIVCACEKERKSERERGDECQRKSVCERKTVCVKHGACGREKAIGILSEKECGKSQEGTT